jgi:hypothetical protein
MRDEHDEGLSQPRFGPGQRVLDSDRNGSAVLLAHAYVRTTVQSLDFRTLI